MYNVVFTDRAKKDFKKLGVNIQKRLVDKLKEFSKDPLHNSRKLLDFKTGSYRFRVGDYRIIFDIEEKDIVILRIPHRKEIYR